MIRKNGQYNEIIKVPENELTDDEIEECIRFVENNFSNVTLLNDDGTVSK